MQEKGEAQAPKMTVEDVDAVVHVQKARDLEKDHQARKAREEGQVLQASWISSFATITSKDHAMDVRTATIGISLFVSTSRRDTAHKEQHVHSII